MGTDARLNDKKIRAPQRVSKRLLYPHAISSYTPHSVWAMASSYVACQMSTPHVPRISYRTCIVWSAGRLTCLSKVANALFLFCPTTDREECGAKGRSFVIACGICLVVASCFDVLGKGLQKIVWS